MNRSGVSLSRAWRALALTAALSVAAVSSANVAHAEPTEEQLTAARERFKAAVELEGRGDWEAARAAFEDVAATKESPQVVYHLALCDEHLGQWLAAMAGYDRAIKAAGEVGESARGVIETATKQRDELAARMPRLRIEIRGTLTKEDELYVDGKPMDLGVTLRDLQVDPGNHGGEIKRGGEVVASGTAEIAAGERGKLRIELPKASDKPAAPIAPPRETGGGVGKIPAYVVGGIGVAALIGSGVTFGLSRAAVDDVRANCGPDGLTGCDPALQARADDASTLSTVSLVLAGAGVAAVGTGVVLWFVLDEEKASGGSRASAIPLQPRAPAGPRVIAIAPTWGGVRALGEF